MNEVLKQRLVGALILVALGVIFWPIIFVEPESEQAATQRGIPPGPFVSPQPIGAPDPAGLRESPPIDAHVPREEAFEASPEPDTEPSWPAPGSQEEGALEQGVAESAAEPAVDEPVVSEPSTRQEAPEPLSMDADGVPVAWVLQVASVSSEAKATELRDRLLAIDQKAYVERVRSGGRDLHRVYIGPKFEKEKLEVLQARIDREFAVKSMVRRYVP